MSDESFTLMGLGLVVISVRMQVRWKQVGPANWQLDDYLMPLTGIVFVMETVAAYLVGAKFQGLTNSYMTDEERAALDPNSIEYYNRQWGSKIQIIGWSFYALILWLLKACVAVFYSRLTEGLAHLRVRVRIAYIFLGVTYGVVALTLLLSCQPMSKFWQISPNPGNLCQPTLSTAYVLVCVIPNVLTDLYLLSIPLPLLWSVNIGWRRKTVLIGLFSGAIFIMMASTIRAVVILTAGPEGAISGSQWACRETFVAIVITNLPIIQPLIRKCANKVGLSALFSRTSPTAPSRSQGDRYELSRSRNKKKPAHPLSIPQTGAWGSDEHILAQRKSAEKDAGGGIVVAHDISIKNEAAPARGSAALKDDWGYSANSSVIHGSQ